MQEQIVPPPETPIACTLTAADLQDRQRAWLKVGLYVMASRTIPGGLSFEFASATGVAESLTELVRLEAECCAWMNFGLAELPAGIRLDITSVGADGERGVRESFARLFELSAR